MTCSNATPTPNGKKDIAASRGVPSLLLPVLLFLGFAPVTAQVPSLGTAANFGVLGASTVTNTGPSVITGSVGVSPGSAITGFPPGALIGGTIQAATAVAAQAQSDANAAYIALSGATCNTNLTGQGLGGLTLTPGVYCYSSSAQLTGTLTLDAQGVPGAVFIFQIGSTLTTASGSVVSLINAASSCNVFWQIGSSATLGSATAFAGHVIALASITMVTGAGVSGSAVALTGAVTLDTSISGNVCCPAIATIASFGTGCSQGTMTVPSLIAITAPQVGGTGSVHISSPSSPGAVALLLVGFDPSFSPILNTGLPLDLVLIGFPGCFMYAGGDAAALAIPLDGTGQATFTFGVPKRGKFCGQDLAFQALILGPDLMVTNGLLAILGH